MQIRERIRAWFARPKWYFLLITALVAIGSTVGGTVILTQAELAEYMLVGYVLLGVMAVTLSYTIFGAVRMYPSARDRMIEHARKHPRLNRLVTRFDFRTLLFTAVSLVITFAFAVYNGTVAVITKSIWFGALAAYYIVLIILRGSILVYLGKRRRAVENGQPETLTLMHDARQYQICGVILFLLPLCLSFAILQMVRAGDSFVHTGLTIYVYAIYAFFKIITAICSFAKGRKNHSMTIMATKDIKLADAMVSVLALQTAMFKEFQDEFSDTVSTPMNAATGAVVCALTVALGIFMIVTASRRIKRLKLDVSPTSDKSNEPEPAASEREAKLAAHEVKHAVELEEAPPAGAASAPSAGSKTE